MIKISPSLLSCDFAYIADELARVENAGAEYIHLDVMDGMFVPNISFGAPVIEKLREHTKMKFDTHLMIMEPSRYIDDFARAGADIITVHCEACADTEQTLKYIRSLGIKSSVSLKPKTPVEAVEPLLPFADMVLVMSVEPGFGGQKFMPDAVGRIRELRDMIRRAGTDTEIEVDGGINLDNVGSVFNAGATVIVAGTSIFKTDDMARTVSQFRSRCDQ